MTDESRSSEILDEIEAGRWSHAQVRHRMLPLPDAALDAIDRDESRREIERLTARSILAERAARSGEPNETAAVVGALEGVSASQRKLMDAALYRKAARQEAREKEAPPGELEVVPGPDTRTKNELAATQFADLLSEVGLACKPMRTKAISGRGPVVDGWTVNYRDNGAEVGIVAAWWGRQHFTAFVEVAGHAERTVETALLFRRLLETR